MIVIWDVIRNTVCPSAWPLGKVVMMMNPVMMEASKIHKSNIQHLDLSLALDTTFRELLVTRSDSSSSAKTLESLKKELKLKISRHYPHIVIDILCAWRGKWEVNPGHTLHVANSSN